MLYIFHGPRLMLKHKIRRVLANFRDDLENPLD